MLRVPSWASHNGALTTLGPPSLEPLRRKGNHTTLRSGCPLLRSTQDQARTGILTVLTFREKVRPGRGSPPPKRFKIQSIDTLCLVLPATRQTNLLLMGGTISSDCITIFF